MSVDDFYLVTGNQKPFPVKPFIVTPAQMVEILKEILYKPHDSGFLSIFNEGIIINSMNFKYVCYLRLQFCSRFKSTKEM